MGFKENVERDLHVTFFNEDEFAEGVMYYPLGNFEDEEGIPLVGIFDAIAVEEDVFNEMTLDIVDSMPRVELIQSDVESRTADSAIIRIKTGVKYRLVENEYFNDNGVIEFHLSRISEYGP